MGREGYLFCGSAPVICLSSSHDSSFITTHIFRLSYGLLYTHLFVGSSSCHFLLVAFFCWLRWNSSPTKAESSRPTPLRSLEFLQGPFGHFQQERVV